MKSVKYYLKHPEKAIEYFYIMYYRTIESGNTYSYLIDYLTRREFFTKPCSRKHHLACKHGLLIHSVLVCQFGLELIQKYKLPISENSFIIASLLHDVCKCEDDYKEHGHRSVQIISRFIYLTELEKEMITWHMGVYSEYYDNLQPGDFLKWSSDWKNTDKNAAIFLYMCDHFSTMFLEGEK